MFVVARNGGRTLQHHHVVRAFRQFPLGRKAEGTTRLTIPPVVEPKELEVVMNVQTRENMTVLGAAGVSLGGE